MAPKPIQLVLQGGGAKLYALVAALDAVDSAVQEHKIEVRRIAGTSAGAIIGGLYAAGVKPQTMREAFSGFPLDKLASFDGAWRKSTALLKAIRGIPLADDRQLAAFLNRLLSATQPSKGPLRLHDVAIPLSIVASDVSGRERVVYESWDRDRERGLVSCMLDSSAIPFFFRAAGRDSGRLILDGGLCENLASELLISGAATHGDVVAISFRDQPPETPRNARELATALLDTAINAAVRRSKQVADLFLIELDTHGVSTFDFAEAAHALGANGESGRYESARLQTAHRLDELCSAQGQQRVSKNRWDSADPATMGHLFQVYKSQQLPRTFHYFSRRLEIVANSLVPEDDEDHGTRDLVIQTLELAPTREPIDCIAAQIFTDSAQKPSDVSCDVWDAKGRPVPFVVVPVRDPEDPSMYGLLICFTPPLTPSPEARYSLRTEFRVAKAFPMLENGETDRMGSKILRANGAADRVELVVHVPDSFGELAITSEREPFAEAHPMKPADLLHLKRRGRFQVYGWQAEAVPNGTRALIELRRA